MADTDGAQPRPLSPSTLIALDKSRDSELQRLHKFVKDERQHLIAARAARVQYEEALEVMNDISRLIDKESGFKRSEGAEDDYLESLHAVTQIRLDAENARMSIAKEVMECFRYPNDVLERALLEMALAVIPTYDERHAHSAYAEGGPDALLKVIRQHAANLHAERRFLGELLDLIADGDPQPDDTADAVAFAKREIKRLQQDADPPPTHEEQETLGDRLRVDAFTGNVRPIVPYPMRRISLVVTHPSLGDRYLFAPVVGQALKEFADYQERVEGLDYRPDGKPRYPFTATNGCIVDCMPWTGVDPEDLPEGWRPEDWSPFLTREESSAEPAATPPEPVYGSAVFPRPFPFLSAPFPFQMVGESREQYIARLRRCGWPDERIQAHLKRQDGADA